MSCTEVSSAKRTTYSNSSGHGSFSSLIKSFDSYLYKFKGENLPLSNLSISIVTSLGLSQAIGTCNSITKEIQVLESYWNSANDSQKKILIFHELAHCYLNRSHNSNVVNGFPVSMMYPSTIDESDFNAFESLYIEELFTNDSSNIERTLNNYTSSATRIQYSKTDINHFKCDHK
jgi:hypothetical protein